MSLGIVPARELTVARAEAQSRMAVLAAALGLVGAPELAVLGSVPDVAKGIQWRPLTQQHERQQAVLNVPPADPTTGPQIAAVRFSWVVRSPQPIRLKATVQHQLESNLETTDFEVPLSIVSRMMVAPSLLQLGDLNYKEQREVHFFVWSATRPSLDVRIESVSPDECIEVGTPVPLPEQVLSELPQVMLQAGAITQLTRLQCGYTVKVTVHERRGDKHQLELGPLGRRLVVKLNNGSPDDDVNVILTGVVRGAIRVGDASDRDRIDLGTFPARRGVDKRVTITSTDTGINLKVVGKSPEALQVELKEQPAGVGQKRWLLHVEVAPNTFSGMLPSDTAVYLQTDANPPRSIRIPVVGVATH
jgi:hypothetical protein